MFGVVAQLIGLIMIAGSFFFGQFLAFLVVGLCLLGFGTYLGNVPAMPEFIDICNEIYPREKIDVVSDFSSGLYNGLWGLAEFVGPVLGGTLTKKYSFDKGVEIYTIIAGFIFVAYISFGRGYEGLQRAFKVCKNNSLEKEKLLDINNMELI